MLPYDPGRVAEQPFLPDIFSTPERGEGYLEMPAQEWSRPTMSETTPISDENGDKPPEQAPDTGKEHQHETVDDDSENEREARNEAEQNSGFTATDRKSVV